MHKLTVPYDSPEYHAEYPWGALVGADPKTGAQWVIYAPNSSQQAEFSATTVPNVILEGGRGGGKSTCMRGDAHMRCLAFPGFKALILRREMPDLRKTHLLYVGQEARFLGATYNKAEFTVFYENGSVLVFGHCEDDGAISKYLSSEWDAIYFDELVTFEKKQFLLISACARTPEDSGRIAIVRGGTNPIGVGADYVFRYFITKDVRPDEDEHYDPAEWASIKINMDDNPALNRKAYEKRLGALAGLSPTMYKAYRFGLWIREGQFFDEWMATDPETGRPWHVIPAVPLMSWGLYDDGTPRDLPLYEVPWVEIIRGIDWGYDPDPCVVGWYICLPNRMIKFKERVYRKMIAKDVAAKVREESRGMQVRMTLADPKMWAKDPTSGHNIADDFDENGVPLTQANNDRINGWMAVHKWLIEVVDEGHGPAPRLQFVEWNPSTGLGCPYTIRTLPTLVHDEKNPGDCTGREDHAADETRYVVMDRPAGSSPRDFTPPPNPNVEEVMSWIAEREARAAAA